MSCLPRDPEPEALSEEGVVALLSDSVEIAAIWSRRGMIVVRGRARTSAPDRVALEHQAMQRGWALRLETTATDLLVFVERKRARRIPWRALILFVLTVAAVVLLRPFTLAGFQSEGFAQLFWQELPFAYALFPILLAHEFGHYFAARAHHYPASLPYFIPGIYPFGTFGAVIVARYPFRNRKVLFDVAVAGPLAGFAVCIPVLWLGLAHSEWVHIAEGQGLILGDPLLMRVLAAWALPPAPEPGMDILLHASAFGGWAGLFVTMLNLLPFGPLDGGKAAYALLGRHQKWVAMITWGLLCASLLVSYFWVLWLALALVFRLAHPPTLRDDIRLDRRRRLVGVLVAAVFVLSFMPLPFRTLP